MKIPNPVPIVFAAAALVFLVLALSDIWKRGAKTTPSRKAWLRVALIFFVIAVLLIFFQANR